MKFEIFDKYFYLSLFFYFLSMGAVTEIIYASKYTQEVNGLILDSPYSDLEEIISEIALKRVNLPKLLIDTILYFIKNKIKEELGVDIF